MGINVFTAMRIVLFPFSTDAVTMFKRYAIFALPNGPLAEFGAAWLGWDIVSGAEIRPTQNFAVETADIVANCRRYGFHATMKPPFRLADGQNVHSLKATLAVLCRDLQPAKARRLRLTRLGRFLALLPEDDSGSLSALAACIVEKLDHFRAAPDPAELARRTRGHLTKPQLHALQEWGYPYVMDQFRFHFTLTDRTRRATLDVLEEVLVAPLNKVLPTPFIVDSLSLVGEDSAGMFHEIQRFDLEGT